MNKNQLWERVERVACTIVCRVAKFNNTSAHEIEEKVLEKAEAIFLEWSMKMVGLGSSAPTSAPAATTKATAHLAILSFNVEKVVERLVAPKITLDQMENAVPLSLRRELEATLWPLAPKGTLPRQ